jgi:preprotein translocase subunit SecD
MMIKFARFNIYLLASLALLLACGCQTAEGKKKKEATHIELHLETNQDATDRNEGVPIYRDKGAQFYVNVEKEPFLDEGNIEDAKVVDEVGGFAIQLKFTWRGTQLLDGISSGNRGKRIAVYSRFGKDPRWLGAPIITKRLSNGTFTFTPDATREEADRIVRGLNNLAREARKQEKLW